MSDEEWNAVALSLKVSITAVAISLPFAVALGWFFARTRFFGKAALETCVNLPLVLPPVVTGYLLLAVFGRYQPLGRFLEYGFGIRIVFDWKGAALAASIVAMPLMVRATRIAFASVNPRLEQTARSLGAGPLDAFFSVTLPLAWRGVVAAAVLGFARALGEFGATIMIAGNIEGRTRTIPLYIYSQLESPGGFDRAAGVLLISIALSAAALVVGEWFDRRSARQWC